MESVAGATSERHLLNPRRGPPSNYPPLNQGKGSQGTLQNGLYGGPTGLEETQRWRVGDPLRKMRDDNEWDWWCDDECKWMLTWNEKWKLEKLFKNSGEQIVSRGLCLSRSWHKITLVLTTPGAFWIVFPGFQPSYPRYDEPSSLLRQSGCVDICSKRFGVFCTFRRHVTLHLQHGSWLRGVQS